MMNKLIKSLSLLLLMIVGGLSMGVGLSFSSQFKTLLGADFLASLGLDVPANSNAAKDSNEPLYWVAPMDANYRRDSPGKSPMGMDLVPVYDTGDANLPAGTVTISPEVVNNFGVRTALVKKQQLDDNIATVGTVDFDERQLFEVHSRVSGWIKTLVVRANGDEVKKHDRLYDIYSPELVATQEELLVAILAGEPRMREASIEKLKNLGVGTRAIKNIIKTRKAITNISIYAPHAGVVSELGIAQGAYVTPNTRTMSISGMDPVWIEGEIFESHLAKVRLGAKVSIHANAAPGREWLGKVDYIYPELEAGSRTAKMRIIIDNPDGALLPNMFVHMNIDTTSPAATLSVPQEAVIRTGTMDRVVLSAEAGHFKSVKVITGQRSRDRVEILEGLEEGDKIVVSAQFLLDSESSISSDFMRMAKLEEAPDTVWAKGSIAELYADENVVVINHLPVPEWDWPSMEMEFVYSEDVDVEQLTAGSLVRFSMRKLESGEILIEAVENDQEMSQ